MPLHMQGGRAQRQRARSTVGDAERAARVELAACYRIFDLLGWTELIFNHITLRVPGPERVFLINPFGLHYREVTASNLVAVHVDRVPVRPGQLAINRAGIVTHSAIHRHLDAAHCVMHTHTTTGVAAAACLEGAVVHDTVLRRPAAWPRRLPRVRGRHGEPRTSRAACSRASATGAS